VAVAAVLVALIGLKVAYSRQQAMGTDNHVTFESSEDEHRARSSSVQVIDLGSCAMEQNISRADALPTMGSTEEGLRRRSQSNDGKTDGLPDPEPSGEEGAVVCI